MELIFYFSSLVAVLSVLRVITHTHPIYALLYLIVSIISISCIFFSIGAYFAGALEIIVYAGAIMVLFVFVVMMLNLKKTSNSDINYFKYSEFLAPLILSIMLLSVLIYCIWDRELSDKTITGEVISSKNIGIALFGPYFLAVELASMLLLSALLVIIHFGKDE